MSRIESNVMVNVLDMDTVKKDLLAKIQESQPDVEDILIRGPTGFIKTKKGEIYCLDMDGVGNDKPLGHVKNPHETLYIYITKKSGTTIMPLIASFTINMAQDELNKIPVKCQINLAAYIRTFGSRLEYNFATWHKAMTKKV